MYQSLYFCLVWHCGSRVKREGVRCDACAQNEDHLMPQIDSLVSRSRLNGPNGEQVAVAPMKEYAA